MIITDDAGESLEIRYAQHRFLEAGWKPVIAASKKKLLHGVVHDFEPGWNTYVERPGYLIQADASFEKLKAKDFEAVILIGGRAPEYLRHNAKLIKLVKDFDRQGKLICAICHGIQILLAAGIGRGRKLTCYEHVRYEVEHCGGTWIDQQSVVDGNLVTAQTWESHPEFYRHIFARLSA